MTGRSHITCTLSMVTAGISTHMAFHMAECGFLFWGHGLHIPSEIMYAENMLYDWLWPAFIRTRGFPVRAIYIFLCLTATLTGTLCTDCDKRDSLAGRVLYVPVEHKTWLHAVWIPMMFFACGFCYGIPAWFGIGWFLHEFMDSFSVCGIAYLYPFTGYRRYGYAKIKRGMHFFRLYRTGEYSEYVFTSCVMLLCVFWSMACMLSPYFEIRYIEGVRVWT